MTATKRRDFLAAAAIAGTATLGIAANASAADEDADKPGIENGRIRQSVMGWCFKPMDAVTLAQHCKQIGLQAIEGVGTDAYPAIKALGLEISLVGSHGFKDGPVNADNHAMVEAKLRQGIDTAVKSGAPSVITFTGMREEGLTDKVAIKNCLDCWKRVVPYAEEKGITIVLEHLNSRDNSHPMKGHPGYWGDDLHLCAELVNNI
ncbi:MAG: TIM barrel protein, partial [Planctomycetota bacterium]